MVEAWEQKLGVLNQMVGSVEPRPEVWDRIKAAIGHSEQQAPLLLPDAPPPPPRRRRNDVSAPATPVDTSNVIQLSARARRWRNVATLDDGDRRSPGRDDRDPASMRPDRLPDALRPKVRTQVVEVKTPPAPAPPSAQYVAVLQKDSASPAFILTVDGTTRISRCAGSTPRPSRQEL